jgi:hypothetical protein
MTALARPTVPFEESPDVPQRARRESARRAGARRRPPLTPKKANGRISSTVHGVAATNERNDRERDREERTTRSPERTRSVGMGRPGPKHRKGGESEEQVIGHDDRIEKALESRTAHND